MNADMLRKMQTAQGFIAALDQSGGSTPSALARYGIEASSYSGDDAMFDLMHQMRTRIMTSRVFHGDRILAAILFQQTMERPVEGRGSAEYLWQVKNIVPFLKVDHGLQDASHGVKLMKPMPALDDVLEEAVGHGVFGTKMRSVVLDADRIGIGSVVDQQFEVAHRILDAGLVPIIEPEVDIHSPQKEAAEDLLRESLLEHLRGLGDRLVMLKLTLPEEDGFHTPLVEHPNVLRVVALSGGYSRAEADERLAQQPGVVASFSRALTEGLTAQQTQEEFDATLHDSIESIYRASIT